MKKLKLKQIRQQFISRLLATLSIASLVLLPLQCLPWGLRRPMEDADTSSLPSWFPQCAPYWWMDIVPKVLVATLVLTAVFSLLNLRLLKNSPKPATEALPAVSPAAAAVSAASSSLRAAPSALG
jgi:hypothetical protein